MGKGRRPKDSHKGRRPKDSHILKSFGMGGNNTIKKREGTKQPDLFGDGSFDVLGDRAARTRARDGDGAARTPICLLLLVILVGLVVLLGLGGGGTTPAFLLDDAILAKFSKGLPYGRGNNIDPEDNY